MFGKKNLIFIMDDDEIFGKLVQKKLTESGFENNFFFRDESMFLSQMDQYPNVVICDYHLLKMNGLQLVEKAKQIHPFFYSILLSGKFHENEDNYNDIRLLHFIDRYLLKGISEMDELLFTLNNEVS